jgi:hypothetical protein
MAVTTPIIERLSGKPIFVGYEGLRALGVPYCRGYLLQLEKAGKFPKRRYLSPVRPLWVVVEVEAWVAARVGTV